MNHMINCFKFYSKIEMGRILKISTYKFYWSKTAAENKRLHKINNYLLAALILKNKYLVYRIRNQFKSKTEACVVIKPRTYLK